VENNLKKETFMTTVNIKDINLIDTFFHFTLRENLESIQKHGLLPNIGAASKIVNEEKPRVYMSKGGKGILEIKNSFIHKFKGLRICDIPVEYRKYFNIKDFSSNAQATEELIYEAMEKRFKDEIFFKVDAIEGEDFLPEDAIKEIRNIKGKENHSIDAKKLTLLVSDAGPTALNIVEYLYNRLLEIAREKGVEDSVRKACSDLDGLFQYINKRDLKATLLNDNKSTIDGEIR